ncbi:unnamed protein product [Haemonchus placei]|uniref:MARVEL domain-containing protein n=1 Tax=Haemonchus placei TaxID=6290 RepID=A0A0N4WN75_HAEPC|nr:unnamed protein product [Haemonchus placei]
MRTRRIDIKRRLGEVVMVASQVSASTCKCDLIPVIGLHTLRIMLVAMSIVFALLAMVTGTACFFYPFLFVVVSEIFEFVKSLAWFGLLALKLSWPAKYKALIKEKGDTWAMLGLEPLQDYIKSTKEDDEILYLWFGFCCFYFALLIITLIKTITEYQLDEHRRQNNPYVFPAVGPYPHVVVLPAEPEMGNTNPDDPPPYSTIVRNDGDSEETAKEETLPPRYSDLELSSTTTSTRWVHLQVSVSTEPVMHALVL